jgi:hypothetical protein
VVVGDAYLLSGPFVCRCLTSAAVTRFHLPLVEPDVRICRIRLSDQVSCVRACKAGSPHPLEPNQPQLVVQVLVGESCLAPPLHLVLPTQPPAEPIPNVSIQRPVGVAHRSRQK